MKENYESISKSLCERIECDLRSSIVAECQEVRRILAEQDLQSVKKLDELNIGIGNLLEAMEAAMNAPSEVCDDPEDFSHYGDNCTLIMKEQEDEPFISNESAQVQNRLDRVDEEIHILKKKMNWILQEFAVPDIKKKEKRKSKKQKVGR